MRPRWLASLAVSLLLASAACGRPAAVHYAAAGSVTGPLLFRRDGRPGTDSIRNFSIRSVDGRYAGSRNGQVVWSFASRARLPAPDSIIYGVAPEGFVSGVVLRLSPGRYEIEVSVGNHSSLSRFTIDSYGRASQ